MAPQQRKRINISLLIPFLVIAVVFGTMIWQKYRESRLVPVTPQVQPSVGKRTAVLFFVADGIRLAREARELDPCEDAAACLSDVLEELLNGPVGEFDESLPEGTVVNSVRIDGDLAGIDLNHAFVDELPSGSSGEMLAVYSIVNTVAVNFPQITKVKLTVEGEQSPVLKHLDLSEPLTPDYSLEQTPQADSAAASKPIKLHKGKP
jgi:spore germination protein GerM